MDRLALHPRLCITTLSQDLQLLSAGSVCSSFTPVALSVRRALTSSPACVIVPPLTLTESRKHPWLSLSFFLKSPSSWSRPHIRCLDRVFPWLPEPPVNRLLPLSCSEPPYLSILPSFPSACSSYHYSKMSPQPSLSSPTLLPTPLSRCCPPLPSFPSPPPIFTSCCKTILYTLAFNSVHTKLVFRSSIRRPSSTSAVGRSERVEMFVES